MLRKNGVSTPLIAIVLVVLVAGAGLAYYYLGSSQGPTSSTTPSSSSSSSTSSSSSSAPPTSSSTTSSSSSTQTTTSSTTSSTSSSSTTSANKNPACGTPAQGVATVKVGTGFGSQGFSFAPQTITVVIGVNNTVQWKNNDSQGVLHTVTSNPAGSFDSANLAPQETFTCAFITAGTYNYYCIYHPEMIGTVIVKSP